MIGSSKKTKKIMRENAFEHKKKKLGLNLTPGEALIGLRTTGPRVLNMRQTKIDALFKAQPEKWLLIQKLRI